MDYDFKLNGKDHCLCARGCGRQNNQLNTYDYLADVPGNSLLSDLVEVQFKNTRKGYYRNTNQLPLEKGDIVAVEASPGHDIGTVTLTGKLVPLQMKKAALKPDIEIKRVYRKAKPVDMEKYEEAKAREHATMIRSRQIAKELGLEMKIGDVEYQGDGNKAIFYYIADGRVDFRQLIKVLAEAFHVRIEMKQIGARQEAGRIGGIGPCGRELCCATWMKSFVSVSTSAARFQDISLNPQKLAGQCAKLKCCMNYEVDMYVEAGKRLPSREITLLTQNGEYFFFKADILSGMVTYSSDKNIAANLVTLPARRAFEIIGMNRKGEKPERLDEQGTTGPTRTADLVEQESLTRFDKRKKSKSKGRGRGNEGGKPRNNGAGAENRTARNASGSDNRPENRKQRLAGNNEAKTGERNERRESNGESRNRESRSRDGRNQNANRGNGENRNRNRDNGGQPDKAPAMTEKKAPAPAKE